MYKTLSIDIYIYTFLNIYILYSVIYEVLQILYKHKSICNIIATSYVLCILSYLYIYIHICICYRSAAAHSKRRLANRKYDEFDGSFSALIWTYCHVDMLMFPEVALLGISMPAHGMI